MLPNIEFLGKTISIYQIMAIIGIFVAGFFVCSKTKERKIDDNDYIIFLLYVSIGVLIGGHLLYGITNLDKIIYICNNLHLIKSFNDILSVLYIIFGGSVFYGGLIGGIIVGLIVIKKKKLNKDNYGDLSALFIPLFHCFGRIGCFLSGCCFGIKSKYGVIYHYALVEEANNVIRFPIQLVEALFNLILFFVLYKFFKEKKYKGNLIYIYLLSYAVARFIFEFFRGDLYRGFLFGLSTSQIISILIIVVVLIIIINKVLGKRRF